MGLVTVPSPMNVGLPGFEGETSPLSIVGALDISGVHQPTSLYISVASYFPMASL